MNTATVSNPESAPNVVPQNHWANNARSSKSNTKVIIVKDTKAWGIQVWISFAIAVFLCGVGLAYLPGADLDRAFMVMGYFFCLSTAFVLSKYVRDNAIKKSDTPMFGAVVYVAFAGALALTGWGLLRMSIADSYKAYLLVSWLYLITTTFTLAKTLRDRHEVALAEARYGVTTTENE
ncbi:MAG: YiaA/YiaB family inner membrane protein [Casimicrobium sp.]